MSDTLDAGAPDAPAYTPLAANESERGSAAVSARHHDHPDESPHSVVGRDRELATLAQLLFDARAGRSRSLVLRGEPGIGKTALLDEATVLARGMNVVRISGVQSEGEFAYGVLHALWSQLPAEGLDSLPEPQRTALKITFGLESGPTPNPFLLGLALLNQLADLAECQPTLILVDDAQWLDDSSARTLGFVARRLQAESIGLLFAVRTEITHLEDLPVLQIRGLSVEDSRALYSSVVRGPVDELILARFISETNGNPLALLESHHLPHEGLRRIVERGERGPRLEEGYKRRVEDLSAEAGLLLLTAAAEPLGDATLLWRAAKLLDIPRDAVDELDREGLLHINARVLFRHPLVRSAVYRFAGPDARRAAHRALAEVTDASLEPERHAWHRALATAVPDEEIATELERAAVQVARRGGHAAAAALLERALTLTADDRRTAARALAAAQAMLAAGEPRSAGDLLSIAKHSRLDKVDSVLYEVLAARLAYAREGARRAPMLVTAAKRQARLDPAGARETLFEAIAAALNAGGRVACTDFPEVAQAARAAIGPRSPRGPRLLAEGISTLITSGYPAAAPTLHSAVAAMLNQELSLPQDLPWISVGILAAVVSWNADAWDALTKLQLHHVRALGAFDVLPQALSQRVEPHIQSGELTAAESVAGELRMVCEAMGAAMPAQPAAAIASFAAPHNAMALIDAEIERATAREEGGATTQMLVSKAILSNALGYYQDAWAAATTAYQDPLIWATYSLGELIEAAARSGRDEEALSALEDLSERARAAQTSWALGIEARSRALLSDPTAAEPLYRASIDHLQRTRAQVHLARSHLLYGEWLRRKGRRVDARIQLHAAFDMFRGMGAIAFTQRAQRELAATGETARKRIDDPDIEEQLTDRETQIGRLAAAGLSNREIGQQLFISHRTVGYHLAKVFAKLEVTSRALIGEAMLRRGLAVDRSH